MMRPRVTIASLLVVILGSALAFGALRSRTPLWASICFTALVASLGLALLVALRGREPRRSFALGYVVFGSLYWLLAFGLGFSNQARPHLVTSQLLEAAYPHLVRALPVVAAHTVNVSGNLNGTATTTISFTSAGSPAGSTNSMGYALSGGTPLASGNTFVILPASSLEESERFQTIGHAILAILIGLGGGFVAVLLFHKRSEDSAGADGLKVAPTGVPLPSNIVTD